MKNLVFAFILLAFLDSCKKNEKIVADISTADTIALPEKDTLQAEKKWLSKNQDFLDKFKWIEIDSTKFVAPDYGDKGVGPKLTKKELQLFPETLDISSFTSKDYNGFEAHSKFYINKNSIGIVARMPGEYSFTSLKLFFYDKNKDEILPKYFELADKLGDAGYSEEIRSWLWKENNRLRSFSYKWTKVEKVEPDDPTRESRTDDYYLITLSPEKIDTARVSKRDLVKYENLLNQK